MCVLKLKPPKSRESRFREKSILRKTSAIFQKMFFCTKVMLGMLSSLGKIKNCGKISEMGKKAFLTESIKKDIFFVFRLIHLNDAEKATERDKIISNHFLMKF